MPYPSPSKKTSNCFPSLSFSSLCSLGLSTSGFCISSFFFLQIFCFLSWYHSGSHLSFFSLCLPSSPSLPLHPHTFSFMTVSSLHFLFLCLTQAAHPVLAAIPRSYNSIFPHKSTILSICCFNQLALPLVLWSLIMELWVFHRMCPFQQPCMFHQGILLCCPLPLNFSSPSCMAQTPCPFRPRHLNLVSEMEVSPAHLTLGPSTVTPATYKQ